MSYHEGDGMLRDFWIGVRHYVLLALVAFGMGYCSRGNAEPIFANGFEAEAPGADPCAHLIQPEGWQRVSKTWVQTWSSADGSPEAVWPESVGFPVPVPGRTSSGFIRKGQYLVVPFVPDADQSVTITWDTAQANPGQGYGLPRPAYSMFIGISDTPGDFCVTFGFDPCSRVAGQDSLHWTTKPDASSAVCPLVAGQTYYMNVVMADPRDGLQPGEHSCTEAPNSADGCDVQARHSGS
jgi:hypothetical protein